MKDLYKILGIAESADDDAIKKAYRRLAKENHPDATGGDKRKTERFKEINDAYSVLGDKKKRGEYDRMRHAPVGMDGMPQGFDPEAFAQAFGGGMGGGRSRGGQGFGGDMGSLFETLFGGRGGGRQAPMRGQDMTGVLELDFREAAVGTRKTIRTGQGTTTEIQIPPGVDNGGRLRLAGKGAPAPDGQGPAGDLHLEVKVRPDPHLRRVDDTIELDVPLTVAEALMGAEVQVPTVEGPVNVRIPPGTSSGAKLRLREKGIKSNQGIRGDQICRIQIAIPKLDPSNDKDREIAREIAELEAKLWKTPKDGEKEWVKAKIRPF